MILTDAGYFDSEWLAAQDTSRLRYEADCEHVRNATTLPRHTLLLILGQLQIVPRNAEKDECHGPNQT